MGRGFPKVNLSQAGDGQAKTRADGFLRSAGVVGIIRVIGPLRS
jgi:hypothetical protein